MENLSDLFDLLGCHTQLSDLLYESIFRNYADSDEDFDLQVDDNGGVTTQLDIKNIEHVRCYQLEGLINEAVKRAKKNFAIIQKHHESGQGIYNHLVKQYRKNESEWKPDPDNKDNNINKCEKGFSKLDIVARKLDYARLMLEQRGEIKMTDIARFKKAYKTCRKYYKATRPPVLGWRRGDRGAGRGRLFLFVLCFVFFLVSMSIDDWCLRFECSLASIFNKNWHK